MTFSFFPLWAKDPVCEYFYEMIRYEASENLTSDYIAEKNITSFYSSKKLRSLHLQTFWTLEHGAIILADYLFPDYIGLIATTFPNEPYEDKLLWLSDLLTASPSDFIISQPGELKRVQKEISTIQDENSTEDGNIEEDSSYVLESDNYIPPLVPEEESVLFDRHVKNKDGALVFYSFSDEFLSVQELPDSRILVRGDDKNLYRFFFDAKMRIEKKEVWDYKKNIDTSAIKYYQDYEYLADSSIPYKSVIHNEKNSTLYEYDERGRVSKMTIFSIEDEKKYKESYTSWRYNQEGKVLEKFYQLYTYKNNKAHSLSSTDSKKEVYEYKTDDKSPDYYYYENGELRLKTEYSSSEDYITTTYFDAGFVVESYYKNATRTKDIFYLNGKVKRTKFYE
ncbi:MAG: hypothetical protein K6F15_09515 [Treponema sp.]|nr:hypothetical protein [Treponema sp.]